MLYCVMEIPLLCTSGGCELEMSMSVHCSAVIQASLVSSSPHVAYVRLKPPLAASGLSMWPFFDPTVTISVQSYCVFKLKGQHVKILL